MHFCTNEEEFNFVTVHLLGPEALHLMHIIITRLVIIMSYSNVFFLRRLIDCFRFYSAFHHKMRQHLPGIHMWTFVEIPSLRGNPEGPTLWQTPEKWSSQENNTLTIYTVFWQYDLCPLNKDIRASRKGCFPLHIQVSMILTIFHSAWLLS